MILRPSGCVASKVSPSLTWSGTTGIGSAHPSDATRRRQRPTVIGTKRIPHSGPQEDSWGCLNVSQFYRYGHPRGQTLARKTQGAMPHEAEHLKGSYWTSVGWTQGDAVGCLQLHRSQGRSLVPVQDIPYESWIVDHVSWIMNLECLSEVKATTNRWVPSGLIRIPGAFHREGLAVVVTVCRPSYRWSCWSLPCGQPHRTHVPEPGQTRDHWRLP